MGKKKISESEKDYLKLLGIMAKKARTHKGFTIQQAASALELTENTVHNLEAGRHRLSLYNYQRLCDYYGVIIPLPGIYT